MGLFTSNLLDMSDIALDMQEQNNLEASQNEPETLEQLRANLGNAYVESFTALDNYTERNSKESSEEYDAKHEILCAAERKLARRYYDMRKQANESVKFVKAIDPNDNQEDDRVPADPQEKDGNDASNY